MKWLIPVVVAMALISVACNNGSSTPVTTPTPTTTTDILTNTVGVLQSASNNFIVGQGGGTVTVTLTSAVQTLPGGTVVTNVNVQVALGTVSGSTCSPIANGSAIAQASSTPVLQGPVGAGTFCVQVTEVTGAGPVAYALAVNHP